MSPVQKANQIKTVRTVEARLNKGWDWLKASPDHAEFRHHEDRWIDLLHQYEDAANPEYDRAVHAAWIKEQTGRTL